MEFVIIMYVLLVKSTFSTDSEYILLILFLKVHKFITKTFIASLLFILVLHIWLLICQVVFVFCANHSVLDSVISARRW
jgi:hypothetical protein